MPSPSTLPDGFSRQCRCGEGIARRGLRVHMLWDEDERQHEWNVEQHDGLLGLSEQ